MWITGTGEGDHRNAKDVLDTYFPRRAEFNADFATILCFLSHRAAFEEMYNDVSNDMADMYRFRKDRLHLKNALTAAFNDLFVCLDRASEGAVGCAFESSHEDIVVSSNSAQNVTLTGNAASLFAGVVRLGYLFKDATGPSHGEYAHTIQWLTIAYAKYYGRIRLDHPVVDLYKNAVGIMSTQRIDTLDADSDLAIKVQLPPWSFLVDCFRSSELHGQPEAFSINLFVENYRSPSYLTDQMLYRRLRASFLGVHLQERYAKRRQLGFVTGRHQRAEMRGYSVAKQKKKDAVRHVGATTNATVPRHLTARAVREELETRSGRSGGTID